MLKFSIDYYTKKNKRKNVIYFANINQNSFQINQKRLNQANNISFTGRNIVAELNRSNVFNLSDTRKLMNYISTHSQPLKEYIQNVARSHQVVMIGDCTHWPRAGAKKIATDTLRIFKDCGYNHVAVEMDTSYQNVIDNYLAGKISFEDLHRQKHVNPYSLAPDQSCSGHFLEECKKLGFKVLCIDRNTKNYANKLNRLNNIAPQLSASEANREMDFIYSRDCYMLDNLKDSSWGTSMSGKLLIFIGNAHILKCPVGNSKNKSLRTLLDGVVGAKNISSINTNYITASSNSKASHFTNSTAFPTLSEDLDGIVGFSFWDNPLQMAQNIFYNQHFDGMIVIGKKDIFYDVLF